MTKFKFSEALRAKGFYGEIALYQHKTIKDWLECGCAPHITRVYEENITKDAEDFFDNCVKRVVVERMKEPRLLPLESEKVDISDIIQKHESLKAIYKQVIITSESYLETRGGGSALLFICIDKK